MGRSSHEYIMAVMTRVGNGQMKPRRLSQLFLSLLVLIEHCAVLRSAVPREARPSAALCSGLLQLCAAVQRSMDVVIDQRCPAQQCRKSAKYIIQLNVSWICFDTANWTSQSAVRLLIVYIYIYTVWQTPRRSGVFRCWWLISRTP